MKNHFLPWYMTWIQKIPLMLKGIMIFEEANKQNMFEQHADKPDVTASHRLTYLVSSGQPWGDLQLRFFCVAQIIAYHVFKNLALFWSILPTGLVGQKLLSSFTTIPHLHQFRCPNPTISPPVAMDFLL